MPNQTTPLTRTPTRLYTAICLFIGIFLALLPSVTGIVIHEWLSLLIVIPLLIHLVVDWKWIVAVSTGFFGKLTLRARFNYCLDWLIFILFTIGMFSGLLVSESVLPAIGLEITIDPLWTGIHIITTKVLMLLLGIHIGMHLDWLIHAIFRKSSADSSSLSEPTESPSANPRSRHWIVPLISIAIAATLISVAILPLANADWAVQFREATLAGLAEDEQRLGERHFAERVWQDVPWVVIFLGIPALITAGIVKLVSLMRNSAAA